jgi:DNA helicase II / ATP-dependent DNA helicase PcrA
MIGDEENINDKEQLLSNFLNKLEEIKKPNEEIVYPAFFDEDNFPSLDEYPVPEDTAILDQKVAKLNQIVARLESKPLPFLDEKILEKRFKIDYRKSLNPEQLLATVVTEGPVLVIAGAGSGKTRVIIHRLSFLIENGINPNEILLLTFTRKASREMLSRAEALLQNKLTEKVAGGTFHSFANYALRKYSNLIKLAPNFTIIDSGDSEDTIDYVRTELKFGKTGKAFPRKERIYEIISSARNRNLSIAQLIENEFTGLIEYIKDIELIARGYAKYKEACQILDYDDLMEIFRDKLRDNPVFRERLQNEFSYIMVDEFQDTNILQKEIVDFLAGKHQNIMVVGDDSQSIYSFRGANYENILRFPETYPECTIIKLEQNYRSNQTLLNFTNEIVRNAKIGYKKRLHSENNNSFKPVIKKFYNQEEEAEFIVNRVIELREKGIELKNIAVLNRAAWHWRFVEMELIKRGIPYVTVGGLAFHERKHIKDFISYLRILLNPYDAVAWHRILKLLPGIGKVGASSMVNEIRNNKGKLNIELYQKRKNANDILELARTLEDASNERISISTKLAIINNYYLPILKSTETDFQIRALDIQVFCDMAAKYEDLQKLLSDFALEPPSTKFGDKTTPLIDESEEKPLTLSTVHSAKGLEWYCVFIPHTLDGLFPSVRAIKNTEEIEEERRLFYVACSRAKEELYITMPSYVQTYQGFLSYPSRFLIEIDKEKYEYLR